MLIVGIMMGVYSSLGLPWCVAAAAAGTFGLTQNGNLVYAPGETPQFFGVR